MCFLFFRWWPKKENQKNLSRPKEKILRLKIGQSILKKGPKLLIFAKVWSTVWSRNRVIQISKKNVPECLKYWKNKDFVNRSNYVMIITNSEKKWPKNEQKNTKMNKKWTKRQPKKEKKIMILHVQWSINLFRQFVWLANCVFVTIIPPIWKRFKIRTQ